MATMQQAERVILDFGTNKKRDFRNYHVARWQREKTAQFPDLEIELVKWITDCRMQGYAISMAELRLKATHLARQSDTTASFRGSISWSYAFLKRHDLSIRRRTNIAQKLLSDYEEQLTKFQSFIIKLSEK